MFTQVVSTILFVFVLKEHVKHAGLQDLLTGHGYLFYDEMQQLILSIKQRNSLAQSKIPIPVFTIHYPHPLPLLPR
jgi:hypothetical protein